MIVGVDSKSRARMVALPRTASEEPRLHDFAAALASPTTCVYVSSVGCCPSLPAFRGHHLSLVCGCSVASSTTRTVSLWVLQMELCQSWILMSRFVRFAIPCVLDSCHMTTLLQEPDRQVLTRLICHTSAVHRMSWSADDNMLVRVVACNDSF